MPMEEDITRDKHLSDGEGAICTFRTLFRLVGEDCAIVISLRMSEELDPLIEDNSLGRLFSYIL